MKKLDVSAKEFDKVIFFFFNLNNYLFGFQYKVAIIGNKQKLMCEDGNGETIISLSDFRTGSQKVWIGLDHVNKAPKRSRMNCLEKAIKIYN